MVIVGIDLGNDYTQACVYNNEKNEPESVDFSTGNEVYVIPSAVLYEPKDNTWLVGEEANKSFALGNGILFNNIYDKILDKEPIRNDDICVMPFELISVLVDYVLFCVRRFIGEDRIDAVCFTVPSFKPEVLRIVERTAKELLPKECRITYSSRIEACAHYALCQPENKAHADIVLLDYSRSGLSYLRIVTVANMGKELVMSEYKDYSEKVPYDTTKSMENELLSVVTEEFDRKNISTVYLTGDGFSREFETPQLINFLCTRRRVFAGQNIYSKGACYQAYEESAGSRFKNTIFACNERITTGIELKIEDHGIAKVLRLVKPGINWYKAGCSYDFILNDCNELNFFLSPVDSSQKEKVVVSLADFPVRENKTTRITVELSFEDDKKCHLKVSDRGFGEIVKSSERVIEEDFEL